MSVATSLHDLSVCPVCIDIQPIIGAGATVRLQQRYLPASLVPPHLSSYVQEA